MGSEQKKLAWWYVGASLFFVLLLFVGYGALGARGVAQLYFLNFFDLTILALAAFRAVRLLTQDKIFQFVRDWFFDFDNQGNAIRPSAGFRRTGLELIECPWCTGLWAALIALGLYLIGPFGRFVVIIFAIAGLGAILNTLVIAFSRIGSK